eukprot:GHVN01018328.1.p1 GENE.GHVN01018328.1~~GHVN01018328.1.p1  ORF type:complete len:105 (+),score=5.51 GHVN01018328.1:71-385(+)
MKGIGARFSQRNNHISTTLLTRSESLSALHFGGHVNVLQTSNKAIVSLGAAASRASRYNLYLPNSHTLFLSIPWAFPLVFSLTILPNSHTSNVSYFLFGVPFDF